MQKPLYRIMIALHILVGVGAMAGGTGAILNPTSPMGMSVDALRNGPFRDFLIPGLFLFCVLGLGNLLAALFLARRWPLHGCVSGALGALMVGWIVIQCVILEAVVGLHVIFFCIGAVQGLLALALLWRTDSFPLRTLRYWFG